jgi:predicted amidohydrolase YtcJ
VALAPTPQPADLVLVSAQVWTGDATRPQVTALAARGGRIVAPSRFGRGDVLRSAVLPGLWIAVDAIY